DKFELSDLLSCFEKITAYNEYFHNQEEKSLTQAEINDLTNFVLEDQADLYDSQAIAKILSKKDPLSSQELCVQALAEHSNGNDKYLKTLLQNECSLNKPMILFMNNPSAVYVVLPKTITGKIFYVTFKDEKGVTGCFDFGTPPNQVKKQV